MKMNYRQIFSLLTKMICNRKIDLLFLQWISSDNFQTKNFRETREKKLKIQRQQQKPSRRVKYVRIKLWITDII